jgi:alpha-1,6-mannosyltransferase
LLSGANNYVGLAADNNGASIAQAVQELILKLESDNTLRSRCQHQAENFPWSSTISQMLSIEAHRILRAA